MFLPKCNFKVFFILSLYTSSCPLWTKPCVNKRSGVKHGKKTVDQANLSSYWWRDVAITRQCRIWEWDRLKTISRSYQKYTSVVFRGLQEFQEPHNINKCVRENSQFYSSGSFFLPCIKTCKFSECCVL